MLGESIANPETASSPLLILVPTPMECRILKTAFHRALPDLKQRLQWRCCGVGPAVSGAVAARYLAELKPTHVILIGIAGSLDPSLPLESVVVPSAIDLEGIGAWTKTGPDTSPLIASPRDLGWRLYEPCDEDRAWNLEPPLSMQLPHGCTHGSIVGLDPTESLTVCAAAGSPSQAAERRTRFPAASIEEMEGFSVAAAASTFHVPMTMIRGISNAAGDRHHAGWRIAAALEAAASRLARLLSPSYCP